MAPSSTTSGRALRPDRPLMGLVGGVASMSSSFSDVPVGRLRGSRSLAKGSGATRCGKESRAAEGDVALGKWLLEAADEDDDAEPRADAAKGAQTLLQSPRQQQRAASANALSPRSAFSPTSSVTPSRSASISASAELSPARSPSPPLTYPLRARSAPPPTTSPRITIPKRSASRVASYFRNDLATRVREKAYDVRLTSREPSHYHPLEDRALRRYFENPHVRDHLVRLGLLSPAGTIVPSRSFQHHQLLLDRIESAARVLALREARDLDRAVEVAVRSGVAKVSRGRGRSRVINESPGKVTARSSPSSATAVAPPSPVRSPSPTGAARSSPSPMGATSAPAQSPPDLSSSTPSISHLLQPTPAPVVLMKVSPSVAASLDSTTFRLLKRLRVVDAPEKTPLQLRQRLKAPSPAVRRASAIVAAAAASARRASRASGSSATGASASTRGRKKDPVHLLETAAVYLAKPRILQDAEREKSEREKRESETRPVSPDRPRLRPNRAASASPARARSASPTRPTASAAASRSPPRPATAMGTKGPTRGRASPSPTIPSSLRAPPPRVVVKGVVPAPAEQGTQTTPRGSFVDLVGRMREFGDDTRGTKDEGTQASTGKLSMRSNAESAGAAERGMDDEGRMRGQRPKTARPQYQPSKNGSDTDNELEEMEEFVRDDSPEPEERVWDVEVPDEDEDVADGEEEEYEGEDDEDDGEELHKTEEVFEKEQREHVEETGAVEEQYRSNSFEELVYEEEGLVRRSLELHEPAPSVADNSKLTKSRSLNKSFRAENIITDTGAPDALLPSPSEDFQPNTATSQQSPKSRSLAALSHPARVASAARARRSSSAKNVLDKHPSSHAQPVTFPTRPDRPAEAIPGRGSRAILTLAQTQSSGVVEGPPGAAGTMAGPSDANSAPRRLGPQPSTYSADSWPASEASDDDAVPNPDSGFGKSGAVDTSNLLDIASLPKVLVQGLVERWTTAIMVFGRVGTSETCYQEVEVAVNQVKDFILESGLAEEFDLANDGRVLSEHYELRAFASEDWSEVEMATMEKFIAVGGRLDVIMPVLSMVKENENRDVDHGVMNTRIECNTQDSWNMELGREDSIKVELSRAERYNRPISAIPRRQVSGERVARSNQEVAARQDNSSRDRVRSAQRTPIADKARNGPDEDERSNSGSVDSFLVPSRKPPSRMHALRNRAADTPAMPGHGTPMRAKGGRRDQLGSKGRQLSSGSIRSSGSNHAKKPGVVQTPVRELVTDQSTPASNSTKSLSASVREEQALYESDSLPFVSPTTVEVPLLERAVRRTVDAHPELHGRLSSSSLTGVGDQRNRREPQLAMVTATDPLDFGVSSNLVRRPIEVPLQRAERSTGSGVYLSRAGLQSQFSSDIEPTRPAQGGSIYMESRPSSAVRVELRAPDSEKACYTSDTRPELHASVIGSTKMEGSVHALATSELDGSTGAPVVRREIVKSSSRVVEAFVESPSDVIKQTELTRPPTLHSVEALIGAQQGIDVSRRESVVRNGIPARPASQAHLSELTGVSLPSLTQKGGQESYDAFNVVESTQALEASYADAPIADSPTRKHSLRAEVLTASISPAGSTSALNAKVTSLSEEVQSAKRMEAPVAKSLRAFLSPGASQVALRNATYEVLPRRQSLTLQDAPPVVTDMTSYSPAGSNVAINGTEYELKPEERNSTRSTTQVVPTSRAFISPRGSNEAFSVLELDRPLRPQTATRRQSPDVPLARTSLIPSHSSAAVDGKVTNSPLVRKALRRVSEATRTATAKIHPGVSEEAVNAVASLLTPPHSARMTNVGPTPFVGRTSLSQEDVLIPSVVEAKSFKIAKRNVRKAIESYVEIVPSGSVHAFNDVISEAEPQFPGVKDVDFSSMKDRPQLIPMASDEAIEATMVTGQERPQSAVLKRRGDLRGTIQLVDAHISTKSLTGDISSGPRPLSATVRPPQPRHILQGKISPSGSKQALPVDSGDIKGQPSLISRNRVEVQEQRVKSGLQEPIDDGTVARAAQRVVPTLPDKETSAQNVLVEPRESERAPAETTGEHDMSVIPLELFYEAVSQFENNIPPEKSQILALGTALGVDPTLNPNQYGIPLGEDELSDPALEEALQTRMRKFGNHVPSLLWSAGEVFVLSSLLCEGYEISKLLEMILVHMGGGGKLHLEGSAESLYLLDKINTPQLQARSMNVVHKLEDDSNLPDLDLRDEIMALFQSAASMFDSNTPPAKDLIQRLASLLGPDPVTQQYTKSGHDISDPELEMILQTRMREVGDRVIDMDWTAGEIYVLAALVVEGGDIRNVLRHAINGKTVVAPLAQPQGEVMNTILTKQLSMPLLHNIPIYPRRAFESDFHLPHSQRTTVEVMHQRSDFPQEFVDRERMTSQEPSSSNDEAANDQRIVQLFSEAAWSFDNGSLPPQGLVDHLAELLGPDSRVRKGDYTIPQGERTDPRLEAELQNRLHQVSDLDWTAGEIFILASLVCEGANVTSIVAPLAKEKLRQGAKVSQDKESSQVLLDKVKSSLHSIAVSQGDARSRGAVNNTAIKSSVEMRTSQRSLSRSQGILKDQSASGTEIIAASSTIEPEDSRTLRSAEQNTNRSHGDLDRQQVSTEAHKMKSRTTRSLQSQTLKKFSRNDVSESQVHLTEPSSQRLSPDDGKLHHILNMFLTGAEAFDKQAEPPNERAVEDLITLLGPRLSQESDAITSSQYDIAEAKLGAALEEEISKPNAAGIEWTAGELFLISSVLAGGGNARMLIQIASEEKGRTSNYHRGLSYHDGLREPENSRWPISESRERLYKTYGDNLADAPWASRSTLNLTQRVMEAASRPLPNSEPDLLRNPSNEAPLVPKTNPETPPLAQRRTMGSFGRSSTTSLNSRKSDQNSAPKSRSVSRAASKVAMLERASSVKSLKGEKGNVGSRTSSRLEGRAPPRPESMERIAEAVQKAASRRESARTVDENLGSRRNIPHGALFLPSS